MAHLVPDKLKASKSSTPTGLSAKFVSEGRKRVTLGSAFGAGGLLAYLLVGPMIVGKNGFDPTLFYAANTFGFVMCATMWLLAWRSPMRDGRLLIVALWFEVALCLLLSLETPWIHFLRTNSVPTVTWIPIIIVIAAVMIPVPARTTAVAAIASMLTVPVGLANLHVFGPATITPLEFGLALLPATISTAIAIVASGVLYGAARDANAARKVGSYVLESKIGEGGMGEVWKGRHALLARPAALKLIRGDMLEVSYAEDRRLVLERFEREAHATADLCSPYTVDLYDFGRTGDGSFYFAMELLDGLNLEHFIYFHKAVPPARAVYWLDQVLRSLTEAHAAGIVHRDVKPANAFVCTRGGEFDMVKVLDFGIAKPVPSGAGSGPSGETIVLGTEGFMAPEQASGADPHPAMDLYAVGGVAWWLLTGHKVFEANTGSELRDLHAGAPVPSLRDEVPEVSVELEAVIRSCLEKDPAKRPPDADTLRRRFLAAVAPDGWDRDRAELWWSEHKS